MRAVDRIWITIKSLARILFVPRRIKSSISNACNRNLPESNTEFQGPSQDWGHNTNQACYRAAKGAEASHSDFLPPDPWPVELRYS